MDTLYIRFVPNTISRFNKELYGFIITRVVNKSSDYIGISIHTDGTSFHCQVDHTDDLGNNEEEYTVTAEQFLYNFPATHSA